MQKKNCVICGKEFEPIRYNQICCCKECKRQRRRNKSNQRYKQYTTENRCIDCGAFLGETYKNAFCPKCSVRRNNYQKKSREKKQRCVKPDHLGEAVQTIKRYNEEHGTHLTYGQYMLKKREGGIL